MMSTHRKTYEKCEACNKKFGRVYKRYPEGTAEEKDSISRYSMESEKNTYRLKKGNTYLLVIFTPDSFRFRKKITKENNYYKEQYLSDIPWSFDLKITYMD